MAGQASRVRAGGAAAAAVLLALCTAAAGEDAEPALQQLSLEDLLELKVTTASRTPQAVRDAPATVFVITERQIRERGYTYLDEALRDLPGLQFIHVHGTFPTIWAPRGLMGDENKRTLLLVDGVVENNILEGNVLGGPQYSLAAVKQIEVILGPASALYGANAFSGIINVITREGAEVDGVEVGGGYGADDIRFGTLVAGKKRGGLDALLSASLYSTDGFRITPMHPDFDTNYVDRALGLVARVSWKGATLGLSRFDRPMGEGPWTNAPVDVFGLPYYGWNASEGKKENGGYSPIGLNGEAGSLWHSVTGTAFLTARRALGPRAQGRARVFYRRSGIADDTYEYDYDAAQGGFYRYPYVHDSHTAGAEAQWERRAEAGHELVLGMQLERSNVEKGYRQVVPVSALSAANAGKEARRFTIGHNLAGYAQYRRETSWLGSTSGVAGARFDYNDIYGSTFNPRLGLVSHPSARWTLKALFGSAYRAPNNFELYTVTAVRIANPELRPERLRSFELSAAHRPASWLLLEGSAFHNRFRDIIVSNVGIGDVDGNGVQNYQNRNVGSATVTGAELRATATRGRFTGYANLSWQDGVLRQPAGSMDTPNAASVTANAGLDLASPYLGVNLGVNAVGRRTTVPTNPRGSVPGYAVVNLALRSRGLWSDRLTVSAVVSNLLDSDYLDPGVRAADGLYYSTQMFQPGRRGLVTVLLRP